MTAIGLVACAFGAMLSSAVPPPQRLLAHYEDESQSLSGERVLRMDLDLVGDDKPELLLAKDVPHVQGWLIYSWNADRTGARFIGTAYFSWRAFRATLGRLGARLRSVVPGEEGVPLWVEYEIHHDGVRERAFEGKKNLTWDSARWRKRVGVRVWSVPFFDLQAVASPRWSDASGDATSAEVGGLRDVVLE